VGEAAVSGQAWIWAGALVTLALYSILYRENRVYRAAEHIFVGLATGYGLAVTWSDILWPKLVAPVVKDGRWWLAGLLLIGGLFYTVFSKRHGWMARWAAMGLLGLASGQAFKLWANRYQPQIESSFKPLIQLDRAPYVLINNVIFLVALITVMLYFFFSFEHRARPVQAGARMGRWMMMIAFGAIFGSTVMARMSLFIGRLLFLFRDWIHFLPR
jgi:hypothetical protein